MIITEIGEGYRSRVRIELRDDTKIEGYISTIVDDYFAVTNENTSKTIKVSYGDVRVVKRQKPSRRSISRDRVVAIVGAVAVVIFGFVAYAVSDRE